MNKLLAAIGWLVFLVLAVGVSLYAVNYFLAPTPGPEATGVHAQLRDRPIWFFMHAGGGAVALFLAPWQFIARLRNRFPLVHRIIGRLYVIAILIGGAGGFILARNSDAGSVAQMGFTLLAIAWLSTTGLALYHAMRRNILEHRRWMIRSTALTAAAITLRIYLGFTFGVLVPKYGIDGALAYIIISWACWVPNLAIAEWYLSRRKARALATA